MVPPAKERIRQRRNRRKRRRLVKQNLGQLQNPNIQENLGQVGQVGQKEESALERIRKVNQSKSLSDKAKENLNKNWLRRQNQKLKDPSVHWQDKERIRQSIRDFKDAEAKLEEQKRQRKQQIKEIDDWIKNNENEVDIDKYQDLWDQISRDKRDKILQLAVNSFSAVEGANLADDALRIGLGLNEAHIDTSELASISSKIFKVGVVELLLDAHGVGGEKAGNILHRVMAREFPIKDGSQDKDKDVGKQLANELLNTKQDDPYATGVRQDKQDTQNTQNTQKDNSEKKTSAGFKSRPMKSRNNHRKPDNLEQNNSNDW